MSTEKKLAIAGVVAKIAEFVAREFEALKRLGTLIVDVFDKLLSVAVNLLAELLAAINAEDAPAAA